MAIDIHKNFVSTTVLTAPSPATSGTVLYVASGTGGLFPSPGSSGGFNCIVYPSGSAPNALNTEIVRVTGITGDQLTIVRSQESTSARTILAGDNIALTVTNKTLTDIEALIGGVITYNPLVGGTPAYGAVQINLAFNNDNVRYKSGFGLQFYNPTTSLWHTLLCTGSPATIGWDGGSV